MNIESSASSDAGFDLARQEYWSKGYTILRQAFEAADVASWRAEVERLWALPGIADDLNLRSEFRRDISGSYVLDRLDPFLDISAVFASAMLDRRVTDPLSVILGGNIELLKCKLIKKDPGTAGYAAHQDFLYWRWLDMAADHLCSVAIPLYRSDQLSGGIEFFPGYHDRLLSSADGDPDKDFSIAEIDTATGDVPALEPGDILVFHALAPHRSGPNRSQSPRVLLLPSYAVSNDAELYARYYAREIKRRCAEFVGFEKMEDLTSNVLKLHG